MRPRVDPSTTRPGRRAAAVVAFAILAVLSACGDGADDVARPIPGADETTTTAAHEEHETTDGSVSFSSPSDGTHFAGPVPIVMTADGVDIEPAGEARPGAGHFHVIVDGDCLRPGDSIPKDVQHVHFGKGQTEAELYLPAGWHELCLQVGDGVHVATGATARLSVEVGVTSQDEWCQVVRSIDEVNDGLSFAESDFPVLQEAYGKGLPLLDQLLNGLDHVAADQRGNVQSLLDNFWDVARAVIDSADRAEAAPTVEDLLAAREGNAELEQAAAWMATTCGIA